MYQVSGFWKFGLRALTVLGFVLLFAGKASATKFGVLHVTANRALSEDQFGSVLIEADNVTFDCAGFMVHSGGATPLDCGGVKSAACGIVVSKRKNVVIKNCAVIGGFDAGIEVFNSSDVHVETSRATVMGTGYEFLFNSRLIGFSLDADNCGNDGYRLDNNADTKLHFAWATGNSHDGFFETNGFRTVYDQDGRAGGNGMDGYLCQQCTDVIYGSFPIGTVGVTANSNGEDGIAVGISKGVRVSRSSANNNGFIGVTFGAVKNSPTAISGVFNTSGINNVTCDARSLDSPGDVWNSNSFQIYCGNFAD